MAASYAKKLQSQVHKSKYLWVKGLHWHSCGQKTPTLIDTQTLSRVWKSQQFVPMSLYTPAKSDRQSVEMRQTTVANCRLSTIFYK